MASWPEGVMGFGRCLCVCVCVCVLLIQMHPPSSLQALLLVGAIVDGPMDQPRMNGRTQGPDNIPPHFVLVFNERQYIFCQRFWKDDQLS